MSEFSLKKYPLPKRFRHHLSPNNYLPLKDIKEDPIGYPPLIDKINWEEVYANKKAPNKVDIGCGFGAFVIKKAIEDYNSNYLGIELRPVPVEYILNVIQSEKISNLHTVRYTVANGLGFIDSNSIEELYYFFPDPWYKKKHIKRRAFNLKFLEECYRILDSNGKFYIQTDVELVHQWHKEIISEFGLFNFEELDINKPWHLPTTNQEEKVLKRGFDIFRIILTKK